MMNQSAQGLASLGRGNDSMLVHMTPREVGGLQQLAMAHGGSLSINPQTGLPEAGFLDAVLPMVGGAALSPFMGPMAAGLLIGGVTALTSGDIGKGLMAGLGGFGGADLGKIFTKMGTSGGIPVGAGADAVKAGIAESLPAGGVGNLGMFTNPQATSVMGGVGDAAQFGSAGQYATNIADLTKAAPAPNFGQIAGATQGTGGYSSINELSKSLGGTGGTYGQMGEGFGKLMEDPFGKGFDAFKEAAGKPGEPISTGSAAFKLGSPVASIALSTMEPEVPGGYVDPDTGKYRGPAGQLNLSDKWSTGLRLAQGGTVTTGGLRDLYATTDTPANPQLSRDGFGIGRLDSLANAEAMNTAKTLGYKVGGYLDGQGDGMSDSIPATIEGKQPARLADGEFVVPADVVSHLGNGSSKAGSKRLYAMLDKVRQARTGTKKQGKEIKPEKYMPA